MEKLKYLIKNEDESVYSDENIQKICDSAYNEDKKRIEKAISYLSKR